MTAEVEIWHTDGIQWWEAKIPRRWHKCKPQTQGWLGLDFIERCACGAIGRTGPGGRHIWMERNARRRR